MKKKKEEQVSNVEIKIFFNRDEHEDEINKLTKKLVQQKIKCNSFEINISTDGCRPINYPDSWEG